MLANGNAFKTKRRVAETREPSNGVAVGADSLVELSLAFRILEKWLVVREDVAQGYRKSCDEI